jgi:hypothetical protein
MLDHDVEHGTVDKALFGIFAEVARAFRFSSAEVDAAMFGGISERIDDRLGQCARDAIFHGVAVDLDQCLPRPVISLHVLGARIADDEIADIGRIDLLADRDGVYLRSHDGRDAGIGSEASMQG